VNCNSVEAQVLGRVPSIAIDKTSGCQVFLSKDSLETEIVTSKSSEMNVSFPVAGSEDVVRDASLLSFIVVG
jgi:adenylyl cyclase-associated protein